MKSGLIVDLVQGSPEWLNWRFSGIGGSDAAAVLNKSPYKSALMLAKEKIAHDEVEDESKEFIFGQGHKVEKIARKQFEELAQEPANPVCMVHPIHKELIASLDGFNSKIGTFEAKLVGAEVLKHAADHGEIPEHHMIQIQHGFNVSGADIGQWYGLNTKGEGVLIEIRRDEEFIKRLEDDELSFWNLIHSGKLPPLGPMDYLEPEDQTALFELREAKEYLENAELEYERLKKSVIDGFSHNKIKGGGLIIFKSERQGALSLLDVPEIAAAVEKIKENLAPEYLESFRKKGSTSWTVKPVTEVKKK